MKLFIVPTPIGNLQDMTFRAINVLKSVDLILAEDTRVSGKLLKHFEINTKMQSYHMHNEHKILKSIVDKLKSGIEIALISDAGTPAISDPGFLLTRACVDEGIAIECLPGATAFVPALVNSGLPNDRFVFEGFLPIKKGRQTRLKLLAQETRTIVIYVSPHKLNKTLEEIVMYFGSDRQISVSRELSKIYEETLRGTAQSILEYYNSKQVKGELVLIISGLN
jgi:16S rRNA (cytidine1402-2'-O)-methyltransferase